MRRTMVSAIAALLAATVAGGCRQRQADAPVTGGGEVLPGSASDAMIRYDTLRSQPPPARIAPERGQPVEAGAEPVPTASAAAAAPPSDTASTPAPAPTG